MDMRLENPEYFWGVRFRSEFEELKHLSLFERELELCLKACERLLKSR
jgi:hypothetical protein